VEAADPLPIETRLHLRLQTDRRTIEVEGRVVWRGEVTPPGGVIRHGVAFPRAASDWLPALDALLHWEERVRATGLRLSLELSVTCQHQGGVGAILRGWTGDVSRGGLSLFLPEVLPPGTALKLTLHTPGEPIAVEGPIVWVEPSAKREPGELIRHGLRVFTLDGSVSTPLERLLMEPP
jgi:hypothetical protein